MGTFLFVEVICIFLWIRNRGIDRAIALILSVIVLMQFFEYLLWTNQECNEINRTITALIPRYLFVQSAVIPAIVLYFNAGWGGLYPYIAFISLLIALFFPFDKRPACISPGKCGHLDWNWDIDTPTHFAVVRLYNIALIYVFATLKDPEFAVVSTLFYIISWIVSRIKYGREWSSVWCHSVNAMAIAALVL